MRGQRPDGRYGYDPTPLRVRLAARWVPDGACWRWISTFGEDGYGRIGVGSRSDGSRATRVAHRVMYEELIGPVPDGLDLDHLCRNRWCVNPDHLEPVTRRQNLLRGEGLTAARAAQTHCARGHLFDEVNTYIAANGTRHCRSCRRKTR